MWLKLTKYFFQHEEQYKIILQGVQGDSNTKKLASQFIARFFAKFPTLGNAALDAILDLCEDEDIDIRKQAIKDLPINLWPQHFSLHGQWLSHNVNERVVVIAPA